MQYHFDWKAILVGAVFLAGGGYRLGTILQAKSWPEKEAIMEKAEIVAQSYSSGMNFRLDVLYRWVHEGRAYSGTQFSMDGTLVEESKSVLEEKAGRWLEGGVVQCYMNPANPEQAVLEPARNMDTQLILVVIGILLLLWGAAWPVWQVRREQKENSHRIFPANGYAMLGISLLLGVTLTGMAMEEWTARSNVRSWIETPCQVLESRAVWEGKEFRPLIRYSWNFNGRAYEGQKVSPTAFFGSITEIERLVEHHPAGGASVCWVNPAEPFLAVLDRDPPWHGMGVTLCIAVMMAFFVWRFVGILRQWRNVNRIEASSSNPGVEGEADMVAKVPPHALLNRETFLKFMSEMPVVSCLTLIVLPCLAFLVWILPTVHSEMTHGVWLTLLQCLFLIGASILLTALMMIARRFWKS